MKLKGIFGKGSGKLGSSVFAISGGEQIVREYNPRVANPNTDAQVAQRAKMKLMSQLAAALASGLAFKKSGLKSARNLFVSKNIGLCSVSNGKATCEMTALQLTPGTEPFSNADISISAENILEVASYVPFTDNTKKVIVVVCEVTESDKLEVKNIGIANVEDGEYSYTYNVLRDKTYITFVYGWKPANSANNVSYEDYVADAETGNATLESALFAMMQEGVFSGTFAQKNVNS